MKRKIICIKDITDKNEFYIDGKLAHRLTGCIFNHYERYRLVLPTYSKGKTYEYGRPSNIDMCPKVKEEYCIYIITLERILKESNLLNEFFMDFDEFRIEKIKSIKKNIFKSKKSSLSL